MNLSLPFISRPIATTLVTIGLTLAGAIAFFALPVAPLPQVDFPTISVTATLPGASPETMAATVATPLERVLGQISGITELTSSSSQGNTRVTIQFELSRDINGAARDVQAAINAARPLLPSGMPSMPTYRKVNPADSPVMIIALTSATMTRGQMYDAASTILAQRISQIDGIGQVTIGGGALPAVRVDLDPNRLAASGIALSDVQTAVNAASARRPLGTLESDERQWQLGANDQYKTADQFSNVIVRYQNNAGVRLGDIADVQDSVEDVRNYGVSNGKAAILLILNTQPGANIIETVARVNELLPFLRASIPEAVNLDVVMDRTPTIRGSLHEVERTLMISIALVVMVVFMFLRRVRATLIPSVVVPVSLIGTFGAMYLFGFSLNNLSLMALTVATGFVVDDAIVVLENITRHIEMGKTPMQAALDGSREISFTIVSITLSLIAVFIPLLGMGGIVGRLFREFAVTLAAAIFISMIVSLTTTPAMCAWMLKAKPPKGSETAGTPEQPEHKRRKKFAAATRRLQTRMLRSYRRSLAWALRHRPLMLIVLLATIALNIHLYIAIPKGLFPEQDSGRLIVMIQTDQSISFDSAREKLLSFMKMIQSDPATQNVIGFTSGARQSMMFVTLKPIGKGPGQRTTSASDVINRLRPKLAHEPGATAFLVAAQDVRVGGRQSNAEYQYTLQADDLETLRAWEPKIKNAFAKLPQLVDVNTDTQDKAAETYISIDRDKAAQLGLNMQTIDTALSNAFSQRQVAVIYNPMNQYRVVMELAPKWLESPETLKNFYISTGSKAQVPLSAFATVKTSATPLAVNHQSGFPASTFSFNLPPGVSLGQAATAINQTIAEIGVPTSVQGAFAGTAKAFDATNKSQPFLILAAILTIYIVLGMLYESLLHPLTILSTLPSAGIGALLGLMTFKTDFTIIALIGVILLIGIVKKNAIMMVDVAIVQQRQFGRSAATAIYRACDLRFRPIMMTTVAAICGAIPLALGTGDGAELRQPLGISIVGGLIVSQLLTLYTTPVVYVMLDNLRNRLVKRPHQVEPLQVS
ncbi:MAG TPA: multidrug efflux RND transporter permease subunit [Rhodocyclaceae bacterium]|nr:multidrug efflux RND transporter permease subunit [Rhodocyclaceae bacterium]